jgi:peptide chain release factor 2
LDQEIQSPSFWQDQERAVKITQEAAEIKELLNDFEELGIEFELLKEENEKVGEFEDKLRQRELRSFLSGKYDKGNALLSIFSGAGGQDAQDWATILLRMYERYCQRKGFKTRILEQSFGEPGGPDGRIGTKSATMELKGNLAYGFLKNETGVHRLVRISPFNAKSLRQTSFALVEVLPQILKPEELDIKVKPEDLKTDFYKASGPGGQYVNKRETAVRITHLPTGIIVTCQSERTQGDNREEALKILYSKLYRFYEQKQKKELKEIKGDKISASWGNQIRNYVLHPYKLVKDLRTGVESSNIEGILDGDLNQFIEAEIKI